MGINSSGYYGVNNLGPYSYIFTPHTDLRLFNNNGTNTDTAILLN